MNIGIIGYGNMGSLITNNILELDLLFDDEKLIISNRHIKKLQCLKEEYNTSKLEITDDNTKVAKECEKIIIAVETNQLKEVIEEIKPHINSSTHIIYTCAGIEFKHIENFFDGKLTNIIPTLASRASLNNSVASSSRRKGISLIKHNDKVNIDERLFIEDLFNEFSYIKRFEDKNTFKYGFGLEAYNSNDNNDFEIATILTSCGPAFIAVLIEKFAEISSQKSGLTKTETEEMILKTILGTTILKNDYKMANEEIINTVATKGGITQEGVDYLNIEIERISKKLLNHLKNRFDEVNTELDEEYLN